MPTPASAKKRSLCVKPKPPVQTTTTPVKTTTTPVKTTTTRAPNTEQFAVLCSKGKFEANGYDKVWYNPYILLTKPDTTNYNYLGFFISILNQVM